MRDTVNVDAFLILPLIESTVVGQVFGEGKNISGASGACDEYIGIDLRSMTVMNTMEGQCSWSQEEGGGGVSIHVGIRELGMQRHAPGIFVR